ncbi:hypothetical protein ACFYO2_28380 [Streptomyces sp. NPDC006602]|uniref:hypothetical protein n=1 Tax=Streptomyces sp. NPDC006602 TaxID=3364751 RepID=UPI00369BBC07
MEARHGHPGQGLGHHQGDHHSYDRGARLHRQVRGRLGGDVVDDGVRHRVRPRPEDRQPWRHFDGHRQHLHAHVVRRQRGRAHLLAAKQIETVSVACDVTPSRKTDGKTPGDIVTDERTLYDKGAYGATPITGLATATERLVSHDGTKGTYQTTGTTGYDDFGRPTSQKDLAGALTTTEYTDVDGLISATEVTNDLGHITTTNYDRLRGQSTGQTDPNTKRTDPRRARPARLGVAAVVDGGRKALCVTASCPTQRSCRPTANARRSRTSDP